MTIIYEFGGDDYDPGEDFAYEISYDGMLEAVSNYMADSYIHRVIQKHKPSSEQAKKLRLSKHVLADAFYYTLKDFELIPDEDCLDEDMIDAVKEYWEEEAREEWINSKD